MILNTVKVIGALICLMGLFQLYTTSWSGPGEEEQKVVTRVADELLKDPSFLGMITGQAGGRTRPSNTRTAPPGPASGPPEKQKYKESLRRFFGDSEADEAIKDFIAEKHAHTEDEEALEKLAKKLAETPDTSMEAIERAYFAMPGGVHAQEHIDMLDLVSRISLTEHGNPGQATALAKDLFKGVIDSKVDPVKEADPLSSVALRSFVYLMKIESDPAERKKYANQFLQDHRSPAVKAELKRILETHDPEASDQ